MKVNSTKSMVGHLLGAAGAIEFVTCVKEIQDSFVHATVGYTTPDEELDLDYCKEAVQMDVPYALSNSLGFGGHNASILLKNTVNNWEEMPLLTSGQILFWKTGRQLCPF